MFSCIFFFFFNDTATTEIYTLSLHDALPISGLGKIDRVRAFLHAEPALVNARDNEGRTLLHWAVATFVDRKSTRLNSSHANISYAVFCLKKKKKKNNTIINNKI